MLLKFSLIDLGSFRVFISMKLHKFTVYNDSIVNFFNFRLKGLSFP